MNIQGKKVLVTGAGGFIGSHLTEQLVTAGARVSAFVRYNSKGNWGWLESSPVKKNITVITGDIRDYDSVKGAMKDVQVVFHLAALIGIPYSYQSPLAYIKTNIEGTYNILQAARELGVEKIIQTSTSEVYGTARFVPIHEEHPLQPQSPYSASKIGADNMALSFYHAFNLPVVVARPFNTYGPRQSARAIIPTIISQILNRQKEIVLGNLTPTRDLNFVLDTVKGFIKIAETDDILGETINIGSGTEISIGDLAKLISTLLRTEVVIKQDPERIRPGNSEVERLVCDNTKIKRIAQWQPQYSLEDGLKLTIEWLKGNLQIYKPEQYNV
jgi:dTDP-glucose 4,6-dehydratase